MSIEPTGHSLETLAALPTWEWPDDAIERITLGLQSDDVGEQCLAARLAGFVPDDGLASLLLRCLQESEDDDLLVEAAIALGPILEEAHMGEFSDEDMPAEIGPQRVHEIQTTLHKLYMEASAPMLVRRRALEAAVRSPAEWQIGATRAAFHSGDSAWRITSLFAMGYLGGFEQNILDSLTVKSNDTVREAITAAGRHDLQDAGPLVLRMAEDPERGKDVQRAAIEAIAHLRPVGTIDVLKRLIRHPDPTLAATAQVALDEALMWEDIDDLEAP